VTGFAKKALFLFFLSVVSGCVPNPNIDLLAPREGKVGDVIDIRDPDFMSLGTEGSVSFGPVQAPGIRKWTDSDVYVEVPGGISGKVWVTVTSSFLQSNRWGFLIEEEDSFPRVMSFGDSVTYWGCNWLAIRMEEDPYLSQFNPVHMNQGTRGEKVTDAGTLVRWQDALSFYDLDFAVLMHAVNDLTDAPAINETITLEQIQQSMISMIDAGASTQTTLILCTLPPRVDSCGDTESPTTEEYNAWLSSYAAQRGISLVDVYGDFLSTPGWGPLYFGTKCLHPDADGYARIAELVNEKIVEIFLPTCTDLDTDGYGDPAAPPCPYPDPDCDDSNPDVHPGIIEASYGDPVCSDGLDNDCDGDVDLADSGCQE
jgi:lysophospholipase L1-like esterase